MLREEGLYEVEALSDGVESVKHGWEYLADPRPGVMTIEPLLGVLDVQSEYQMGLIAHFKIRRLAKGERHPYAAKLNIHSDVPARPMFLLRPITEVRNFVIRLHFEKDPSLVWRFSDLEAYQLAPIEKPILDALVKPENGWYTWRFENLRPYLCYGLAWRL